MLYLGYTSHTHHVFALSSFWRCFQGEVRVDIDNSAIRYYSGTLFYFVYISSCNLVFAFVHVIIVKVIVIICEDGVKLNYFHLILNQKEPYTDYIEN